jgi:hypothetical protein
MIQMEFAISTVERAKEKASLLKKNHVHSAQPELSLSQLLVQSSSGPMTLYK